MRLYAATSAVSYNTVAPSISSADGLDQCIARANDLGRLLREAKQVVDKDLAKHPLKTGQGHMTVLLAPEYFFSKDPTANSRFLSQNLKTYVVDQIVTLGRSYPGTLVVPGTVTWWRRLYKGDGIKETNRVAKSLARVQGAKTRGAQNVTNLTSHPDRNFLGAEGWSYSRPGGPAAADWGHINVDDFDETMLGDSTYDAWLAQNTAYIGYRGRVLKYHKTGAYKEVDREATHNVVFIPGNLRGAFKIGDVRFGIEICRDHAVRQLSSYQKDVDVHLIVSNSIGKDVEGIRVLDDGVVIHADADMNMKDYDVKPVVRGKEHSKVSDFVATKVLRKERTTISVLKKSLELTVTRIDATFGHQTNYASQHIRSKPLKRTR